MLADVGAAREAHAARHLSCDVRNNVAIQIWRHDHIKNFWPRGQPCSANVDDVALLLNIRVLCADLLKHLVKQAIRHLHDVVFDHAGDFFAAIVFGIFKGITHDFLAAGARDELQALKHLISLSMLNASIQILFVFPHDHHVHLGMQRVHIRRIAHAGAHVGIQAHGFSHRDVQAFVAAARGRGNRRFEEYLGAPQALPGAVFNAGTVATEINFLANVYRLRCNLRASSGQDA